MDLGIRDKVALVFGGSKGIGLGCAHEFAREGCPTVIAARTQATIDIAVAEVREAGGQAIGISADCTTKDGIANAVQAAAEAFGSPDILIFNVDSGPKGAFLEVDDETFAAANNNNVMAFRWAVQAVVPHMRTRGWGRILTIGTNSVKAPHRKLQRAAQNTYRVGALALSKTLSAELGPFGITVNTLGTGAIATPQFREVFTKIAEAQGQSYEEHVAGRVSQWPIRRMGTPEDMAAAAAFLCSDRAGFITGQVLVVDGGNLEVLQ
ncbi:MAG TPA: SDR family oxidoreductase [Sphingopyxis sp.]|uniref:SDR family oxidoreductase n=1 Tax=Sphingopyxis sp. TaxID=1908224 RepID=UPI002E338E10|nr:SDR family oxidoreductase [Sphingopyxis sp.]HEX2813965.1 SDR family oxidoreductase [Sphingopyxis sp.]